MFRNNNILVINTSGNRLEFALAGRVAHIDTERQSIALPQCSEKFVSECGLRWSDLDAIGVVVGPGSFTGIRLGIAYAKGLSMGLGVPLVGISAFDLYLAQTPNAFVAIDSGRGDFFVAAHDMAPCTMDIDTVESAQMKYPQTVGHRPFDLALGVQIVQNKLSSGFATAVVPLYLRPSYVETNKK